MQQESVESTSRIKGSESTSRERVKDGTASQKHADPLRFNDMGWGHPGILRYLPNATFIPRDQIRRTLEMLPADSRVCDVGTGGRRIRPGILTVDALGSPRCRCDR